MTEKYPIDVRTHHGWVRPVNAKRVHYYDGTGRSLCGAARFMSGIGSLDEDADQRCLPCTWRKTKLDLSTGFAPGKYDSSTEHKRK